MNAKISYKMAFIPHPWNQKAREEGVELWALMKVVSPVPVGGRETWEPVAIFNYDSEADLFARHVYAEGLDKKLVEVSRDQRELYEAEAGLRKSRGWT